jgi:hypothetical protein
MKESSSKSTSQDCVKWPGCVASLVLARNKVPQALIEGSALQLQYMFKGATLSVTLILYILFQSLKLNALINTKYFLRGNVNNLGGLRVGHSKQGTVCVQIFPIPKGFREREIIHKKRQ